MKRIIIFFIGILFLTSCSPAQKILLQTSRGEVALKVEIADSDEERQRGLMYREKLEAGRGMLFVFEDEAPRGFWMKNTLIPLDIIYFDRNEKVVSFVEKMEPCTKDPCPIYSSEKPAMYALELPAQSVSRYVIRVGDKMVY